MAKTNLRERGIREVNGVWYVNIQVDGKRKEVRVGLNKEEAIAVRRRLKLMAMDGKLNAHFSAKDEERPVFTFEEAIKEHWEGYLRLKKSGAYMLDDLNGPKAVFGKKDITTITWEEVEAYLNKRLQKVKPSTARKEIVMMGAVLQRQVKRRRLLQNPVKDVDLPKVNDTREKVLTDEEFRRLVNVRWEVDNRGTKHIKTLDPHVRLALVILDYTAMRIGEVLDMRWDNVDMLNGYIFVPQSKNGSRRTVPIHDELIKILAAQPKRSQFVVSYRRHKVDSIRKGFDHAREKAGMNDVRIHDLRHRAITRWVREKKAINTIMAATGHKTFSAFKRYANLRDDDVQDLVGRKVEQLSLISSEEFKKTA